MAWQDVIDCAGRHLGQDFSFLPESSPETIQDAYEASQWVSENEAAWWYLAALVGTPFAGPAVAALLTISEAAAAIIVTIVLAFGIAAVSVYLARLVTCSRDPSD